MDNRVILTREEKTRGKRGVRNGPKRVGENEPSSLGLPGIHVTKKGEIGLGGGKGRKRKGKAN